VTFTFPRLDKLSAPKVGTISTVPIVNSAPMTFSIPGATGELM